MESKLATARVACGDCRNAAVTRLHRHLLDSLKCEGGIGVAGVGEECGRGPKLQRKRRSGGRNGLLLE